MRRFIIDTDTASDDAAAIMIAAMSPQIDLLGVPMRQFRKSARLTPRSSPRSMNRFSPRTL